MTLSVVIITFNEEQNIGRTLASVQELVRALDGEIVVVDSGSTDRTREIAESFGAKVFVEEWKGFAAQKNSAIDKATGDWILSLDADEEVSPELQSSINSVMRGGVPRLSKKEEFYQRHLIEDVYSLDEEHVLSLKNVAGFYLARRNLFLGRWIRKGGFYPDEKLRLFKRRTGRFADRRVHEDVATDQPVWLKPLHGDLIHHSYPTLSSYIEHMNRYSTLGAEMARPRGFNLLNIWLRPLLTFHYNYFLRLGFLDGKEGLLLHIYHAVYVSWKYAKAWELSRKKSSG